MGVTSLISTGRSSGLLPPELRLHLISASDNISGLESITATGRTCSRAPGTSVL